MGKLHELLAIEATVTQGADKLIGETNQKFGKHTEFFTGNVRKLKRLNDSPEDTAAEKAELRVKSLPTTVPDTLRYLTPFVGKMLDTKLSKHQANRHAIADVKLDDDVFLENVPVDFLLDLEKFIPKWRNVFEHMPTLDPSRQWVVEKEGVWKAAEVTSTSQTKKVMFPVIMHEATREHPAQVKESTKDEVVGLFEQVDFSGAATSQQKADALLLCDKLLVAAKEARMRANSIDVEKAVAGRQIMELFDLIFD